MSHGPRSQRVAYPLQADNTNCAPGSGFYLTTEYGYLGERMPNRAGNQPNTDILAGGIGAAYVGGGRLSYLSQRGQVYRKVLVPSNLLGSK